MGRGTTTQAGGLREPLVPGNTKHSSSHVDSIPECAVEEVPPGLVDYEHEHEGWSKSGAHWLQVGRGATWPWWAGLVGPRNTRL